jgi:hypothetical protein
MHINIFVIFTVVLPLKTGCEGITDMRNSLGTEPHLTNLSKIENLEGLSRGWQKSTKGIIFPATCRTGKLCLMLANTEGCRLLGCYAVWLV